MGQAFSKKPLKEVIRENQRMIKKAIRELERETTTLQNQEKKLQTDIKKLAGQGQMGAVRIMAKDLVRTRQYVKRFIEMKSHLSAVSLKMQTIRSQEAMTQAMKGVTKAMVAINKQVSVPALQKMMTEFMKESERSEMTQEMVGEAMDSAFEEDGMAAEEDAVVDQVLAELGIQQADAAPEVPSEQPMKSEEGRSGAYLVSRISCLRTH
mmetsp:Transcript_29678/g.30082  ORF Transcript_29678/g.30082 Transcript_29678/m.30082 type:complete len:209 (+) Transcript_29678:99-725(+)